MGAWGFAAFENDIALDWINDFILLDQGIEQVVESLDEALETDCSDDVIGPGALAAAEVVAALNGNPSPLLPEDAAEWVSGQSAPDAALLQKASSSVQKVYEQSELRDNWEDSGNLQEWKVAIDELRSRLSS